MVLPEPTVASFAPACPRYHNYLDTLQTNYKNMRHFRSVFLKSSEILKAFKHELVLTRFARLAIVSSRAGVESHDDVELSDLSMILMTGKCHGNVNIR